MRIYRSFVDSSTANRWLEHFINSTAWRQDTIRIYGKVHNLPRLQQWYGEPDRIYRFAGIEMRPLPWSPQITDILHRVQDQTGYEYNSVLINYYRDGNDTVGYHSDDEPELGPNPNIASLSLGADRDFILRRIDDSSVKLKINLTSGSLLEMSGDTQKNWEHCLPKRKGVKRPRVNFTFRKIV